jgi:hypothetical protein
MNVGSSAGFGLWGNPGTSTARRDFNTPIAAGDSFALRFDNNSIANGGEVGFALADSTGAVKFRFYFVGGQSNYRITDATAARDSGMGYTSGGLNLTLTLTSSNTYTFSNGATNLTGTLAPVGGSISRLIVENKAAGANNNLYFGAMTHTRQTADSGTVSTNAPALTFGGSAQTDGLPDSWWGTYFENPSDWVAANDPDRDGFSNSQEHALGTDPTDATSRLDITSVVRTGNTTTVEWMSVSGKKYRLYGSPSLAQPDWQPVGSEQTAASNRTTDTHSTSADMHFYRVRLVP